MPDNNAKRLDEMSVSCFINRGPYLDDLTSENIFTEKNKLGSPVDMEIHASIDGFYRYGYIVLYDEIGIRESLPITSNEIISIMYRNTARGVDYALPMIMHFNIFDIEEIVANPNQYNSKRFTGKLLKFHLIESPFFLKYNDRSWKVAFGQSEKYDASTSNIPSATYNGIYIHEIFRKHFTDHLKLITGDTKKDLIELDFQKLKTKMHFVVPSWKTQKMFSYLLDFAKDTDDSGNIRLFPTTNMKTGRPVVNLKSLNYMFKDEAKTTTIYSLTNDSVINGNKQSNIGTTSINQILNHKFIMYDLSSLPSGFSGASLLNFDYATGEYTVLNDNYEESNKKKGNSYFANFGLWSNTISNENTKQFNLGFIEKELGKNYLNNKIIKNRYQLRCEMVTYIDETIQPGDRIMVAFPSGVSELSREHQDHMYDEHMSDEWIVEDIVDKVDSGFGLRKMVCVKDSFFNVYGTPTGTASVPYLPQVTYTKKG